MTTPDPRPDDNPGGGTDDAGRPNTDRDPAAEALSAVSGTRTQATYVGWIVGVLITILLIVFIVMNLNSVQVDLVFFKTDLPIGVSILIAAIAGALITALIGGARIVQLNRALKKAGKSTP